MNLEIIEYDNQYEAAWDRFVEENSINGTFLQTRRFLNYHPSHRFKDASLLVMQGTNIVAVVPACDTEDAGRRTFFSHKGSTFGGIVVREDKYSITTMDELIPLLDAYIMSKGYERSLLKTSSSLFSKRPVDLIDYYLFKSDYTQYDELSFYVDVEHTEEDLLSILNVSRRRGYRKALKNGLVFRRLETKEELQRYHEIVSMNLEKFGTVPVHSLEEWLDLKYNRLEKETDFYGVYYKEQLVAGTMLFYFKKDVFHTQYLAQDPAYSDLYLMNYMDFKLIEMAKEQGFKKFSFGISTEERGKVINTGLAVFKEGFGCDFCVNRTYVKDYD